MQLKLHKEEINDLFRCSVINCDDTSAGKTDQLTLEINAKESRGTRICDWLRFGLCR